MEVWNPLLLLIDEHTRCSQAGSAAVDSCKPYRNVAVTRKIFSVPLFFGQQKKERKRTGHYQQEARMHNVTVQSIRTVQYSTETKDRYTMSISDSAVPAVCSTAPAPRPKSCFMQELAAATCLPNSKLFLDLLFYSIDRNERRHTHASTRIYIKATSKC